MGYIDPAAAAEAMRPAFEMQERNIRDVLGLELITKSKDAAARWQEIMRLAEQDQLLLEGIENVVKMRTAR